MGLSTGKIRRKSKSRARNGLFFFAALAVFLALTAFFLDPETRPDAAAVVQETAQIRPMDYGTNLAAPAAAPNLLMSRAGIDAGGKTLFNSPERRFSNRLSIMIMDERRKLLDKGEDVEVRNRLANIMAGIAGNPANYGGDAVVLMALRGGAARLVLNRDDETTQAVADILSQAAARIEEKTAVTAQKEAKRKL